MAECKEILNTKKKKKKRNRDGSNASFQFPLSLSHSRYLLQYIKDSPEHLGKLEDEMKELAQFNVKPETSVITVKSLSSNCQNREQWKRKCTRTLTEFVKEYSAQKHRVKYFKQNIYDRGPTRVKILKSTKDWTDILIVGVAKEVARKVHEIKQSIYSCISVNVPKEFHKHVIGKQGAKIIELRTKYQVEVSVPEPNSDSKDITIEGKSKNVEAAERDIANFVKKLNKYPESVSIPTEDKYLIAIVGYEGLFLKKMNEDFKVNINCTVDPTLIWIRGKSEDVSNAENHVKKVLDSLTDFVVMEVSIENKKIERLVGRNGTNLDALTQRFEGVIEIIPPVKNDLLGSTFLTGNRKSINLLFKELQRTYSAKQVGYVSTLLPIWISKGKSYQRCDTHSLPASLCSSPEECSEMDDSSNSSEIYFSSGVYKKQCSSKTEDAEDDDSCSTDRSIDDIPFILTWSNCEKDILAFVKNSTFHARQLTERINDEALNVTGICVCLNEVKVIIKGIVCKASAKTEEERVLTVTLETFFSKFARQEIYFHPLSLVELTDYEDQDVRVTWSKCDNSIIVCGLKTKVVAKVKQLEFLKTIRKHLVYEWHHSNGNVLEFVKNSKEHYSKLQEHLSKAGTISMPNKGVTIKSVVLQVEEKEWKAKCQELLQEFFSAYVTLVVSFPSDVSIDREDTVEMDVQVTWLNERKAIVCGLKTIAEKKISYWRESQRKKTLNFIWGNVDSRIFEFVKTSVKEFEKLTQTMQHSGKVDIFDTYVQITGKVIQVQEDLWKTKCEKDVKFFFSHYDTYQVEFPLHFFDEKKNVVKNNLVVNWNKENSNAIITGIKTEVEKKVAELENLKNQKQVTYQRSVSRLVTEFLNHSPTHTQRMQTQLSHLGTASISENQIYVNGVTFTALENNWRKSCKDGVDHFLSDYTSHKVNFHPEFEIDRKKVNELHLMVTWEKKLPVAVVCGLKVEVAKKVEELENVKIIRKNVVYEWHHSNGNVLEFVKNSKEHYSKLQEHLSKAGTISMTNKGVTIKSVVLQVEEEEWKAKCQGLLQEFFSAYVTLVVSFQSDVSIDREDTVEMDVQVTWLNDERKAIVCGLKTIAEKKAAYWRESQRKKTLNFTWGNVDSRIFKFVKTSVKEFEKLKRTMQHSGKVDIFDTYVQITGKVIQVEEDLWKTKCEKDLKFFFSHYDTYQVEFPLHFFVEKKNVVKNNLVVNWNKINSNAIITGIKTEVEKKVAELENLKNQKQVTYQRSVKRLVTDFLNYSPTHTQRMQTQLSHLGTASISGNQIYLNGVTFTALENNWRKSCKDGVDRFLSDYTSHKVNFHPEFETDRKKVNESDVMITWEKKLPVALVCGLKVEVAKKVAELENVKNLKRSVKFEHRCINEDILDFLKHSGVHVQLLQNHIGKLGRVAIGKDYISVTGDVTQMQEKKWQKDCEQKIFDFLCDYSSKEVEFHSLSTIDRTDTTEQNLRIRWNENKTCAIVCGENIALRAKLDALSKMKKKKKSVCYKWNSCEECLLMFVKESSQQLKELQDDLKDVGSLLICHDNIIVNGEILETLPRCEWEMKCEETINYHFKKYSVEQIEIPPMALEKSCRLSEKRQDVVTKWREDCNSLIVYGLSDAVKLKMSSLKKSIVKFQKEEEDRLRSCRGLSLDNQDDVENTIFQDKNALIKCHLIATEVKVKCIKAYKESTEEFSNVIFEDIWNGISIIGRRGDVEKAKNIAASIDVDELKIQIYGAYQFLTDSELEIEVIGMKTNCVLLAEPVQNFDDSTFKYLKDEASSSNVSKTTVYGDLEVIVKEGDITEEKVDAIVLTTDKSFAYGGPLAASVLSKAGYGILHSSFPLFADIHVSDGGNLFCNRVFHVAIPALHESMDDLIDRLLHVAEIHFVKSITIPTIGAGGGGWTSDEVAKGMHEGILKFLRVHKSHFLKKITVMLYPSMPNRNKQSFYQILESSGDGENRSTSSEEGKGLLSRFYDYFSSFGTIAPASTSTSQNQQSSTCPQISETNVDTKESSIDSKFIHSEDKSRTASLNGRARILIASKEKENVVKAKEVVNKLVNKHLKKCEVDDPLISRLKKTQVDDIKKIATTHNVQIVIDCRKDKHSITIQGKHEDASLAKEEVLKIITSSRTVFPDTWEKMTIDEKTNRFVLVKGSEEYSEVARLFLNANSGNYHYFRVKNIERIQNPGLYKQYQSRKEEISGGVQNSTLERRLFHGTARDTVDRICSDGFDRGFAGTANAAIYGKGVYFSTLTSYSHNYAKPGQGNLRQMFLADVLTGDYCVGDSNMLAAPINRKTNKLYDSVVDSRYNPTIFVVFKDASVYPAYIITYSSN